MERVRISGKSYYFVDGAKINGNALAKVIKSVYGEQVCSEVFNEAIRTGYAIVEAHVGDTNQELLSKLEQSKEKISTLESKVKKLMLENFYLTLRK